MASNNLQFTISAALAAGGTDLITGNAVDMSNAEGVLFFASIGTANSGNFLYAQQDTVATMATAANLAGSKTLTTADGQVAWLDVNNPKERYVRPLIARGESTVTGTVFALQYGLCTEPANNALSNFNGKRLQSPAEGAI